MRIWWLLAAHSHAVSTR